MWRPTILSGATSMSSEGMSSEGTIGFGILGAAHYHAEHWLAAAKTDPRARVVGVWDADDDRGRAVANGFDVPFFGDRTKLLAQSDAVGIASETRQHAELAIAAAAAGRHMLVEKPMARTTSECDSIIEAVEGSDVVFMQNFPKRYDAAHQELVNAVTSGRIGDIVAIRIRHGNDLKLGHRYQDAGWYANHASAGGGALMDEGIHAVDLLLWLAGYPLDVVALATYDQTQTGVDLTTAAIFRYDSGPLADVTSSHLFAGGNESVEVYGSEGVALLSGVDLASRELATAPHLKFGRAGSSTFEFSDVVPGFVGGRALYHGKSVNEFLTVLQNETPPPVGLREGRRSVAMVEAAYLSIESGTRITLDADSQSTQPDQAPYEPNSAKHPGASSP